MTEAMLEKQIMDGLRARHVLAFKTHDAKHRPATIGIPDIIACLPGGTFFAIECKSPKGQPTLEQQTILGMLKAQGATTVIARSWDDVERYL